MTLSGNCSDQDLALPLVPAPAGTVYFRLLDLQREAALSTSHWVGVDYLAVQSDNLDLPGRRSDQL